MAAEQSVAEGEDVDQTAESGTLTPTFTVEVLQIIKESQQQHGLRHGDYQRYRGYCARRLRRIRKSIHFMQGDRRRVNPKKVTEENLKDVKFIYLPLMEAERCWSYAMQLKDESNTEPRKRFHMMSRLKKAVQYAEDLAKLCESDKVDARTKLEVEAYRAWMKASLDFEQQNWKSAIELYGKAQTFYEKLGSVFTDEIRDLYKQRVDEIAPNIRYCAYNIGDENAVSDLVQMRLRSGRDGDQLTSKLDELIAQTREKQAVTLSEVTWQGRTIPVKNEHIRVFLLNVQESKAEIESAQTLDSKMSVYESLLKDCVDVLQILRDDLKDDATFKSYQRGQKVEGRVSSTMFLHSYLLYLRQTTTIQRNLCMIEALKENLPGNNVEEGKKITKPQDLVRLYEIIIQNLSDVPTLPGLEDAGPGIAAHIELEILGYKAFRCFYVAESYSSVKKWPEALALYERVEQYANDVIKSMKKVKGEQANEAKAHISSLESLIHQVDSKKYSCRAASVLDVQDITEQTATMSLKDAAKQPLSERLDEYVEDPGLKSKKANLVQFPPDFQPIPCKPLYFDLALNHLEFPSLDDKMEQKQKKGGITGMVSGWFSWGGKK